MRDRVYAAARRAGRDPADITCAYHLQVRLDQHSGPAPGVIAGPPAAVAQQLISFVGLGFTAMSIALIGEDLPAQAERLAREVIPVVRAHAVGVRP
jgi:hypothetical protein